MPDDKDDGRADTSHPKAGANDPKSSANEPKSIANEPKSSATTSDKTDLGSPPPAYESSPGARWWLIPAATFAVGVLLGVVVMAATQSEEGASTVAEATPEVTASAAPAATGSPAPDATIVIPGECVQLAEDSQAAGNLIGQAATAAGDLDAARLADLVREMQATQETLQAGATACRSAAGDVDLNVPTVTGLATATATT
jgi:hypothetical protein